MADAVSIAERASVDATWAPCILCEANRRLDDHKLCCECAKDPIRVELAKFRAMGSLTEIADLRADLDDLISENGLSDSRVSRAERGRARALERLRHVRTDLDRLQPLTTAHFALPLTEDEYLVLVSIMVDIVEDTPTIPELAIYRKLTQETPG